ncbi:N-alpha-acetyltransferase 35, NatC auxiliary subunit-like [Dorcoceras hygrometricum]|uniref:N-alpha-acetyltransferase 35, NatC auxiliary subunit-like n=1 Tax=Dorcoceras hygrometricum TaxID=472368 RepID=A0A2Z7B6G6_9LAMI|nr:N-alpha-acetyltransferase 35, NatC auxiliary subunit-like [Dorcoceras hygrometricum]
MAKKSESERIGVAEELISPSIPSGDGTVWADVSHLLDLACNDLQNDELINGENFNLFAAMSALEIMDPKMDSGIVSTYYSVDEAIENGAAPVPLSFDRTMDIQGLIDIMDHLLSCEATWHKGGSLAQTVFSCLYLLRPERTSSHSLLHSFCRVIRATCNAVVSAVSDARTNEEDDIFIMAYGLPLKGDGDEKCLSMLHAVEETISRQLKACKAQLSKRIVVEDVEPLQTDLGLEQGFCKALLCRLRFLQHFYHVLTCMRRPQGKGLELAKKHIASCLLELDSIRKSEEFLRTTRACRSLEDMLEDKTTASGCQAIGFDSTLNSRSAAPTPPRAIRLLSWKKAVNYFQKLLHDLEIICCCPLDPVFEDALRFVVDFQKLQPDLIARAHIQLLLVQDGKLYGRDPIFAVICKASLLPDETKNHIIQKNEAVVQLGQLELAFRDKFGEIARTSIDQDVCLKICKHMLIWVEEQTYWIALRFLTLGFELELYSPNEYCMVYWYINVILIKLAEKSHLKIMLGNDSARRKAKKKKDLTKDTGKDYQIPPPVLLLQCYIYVAQGLMMMLASSRNQHKVFPCVGPFNSERERFIQHFELLQKASLPDHASYFSFRETTDHVFFSSLAMHNCFKEAHKIAKELQANFAGDPERVTELRRLQQVAEHNDVALNLLRRLGTLEPSLRISFEFVHHPHFAVASVKRS